MLTIRTARAATVGTLVLAAATFGPAAVADPGPQACVQGVVPLCFSALQPALDAAPTGATVQLSAGEFAGGVVISKDVHLVGSGAAASVVRGGGPVILVRSTKQDRPEVDIESLTVTGGVAHGDGRHPGTVNAFGGGLLVPPVHGQAATVHLRHVVVDGNRTEPTETSDSPSGVKCPHGFCPYAGSYGGGIASFGDLTLEDSVVSGNLAGGRASDADGGGIFSIGGTLSISDSRIEGNRAAPDEIGRFAEGGGIFANDGGKVTIKHSVVTGNATELVTSWPVHAGGGVIDMNSHGGGIHVGDGFRVRLVGVEITHNTSSAVDPKGEPVAFDAGMLVGDSSLTMSRSLVADNTVTARVNTTADVGFSGTALEVDGPATITRTQILDNVANVFAKHGVAAASSGLAVYDFFDNPRQVVVTHSLISGNLAIAQSPHGTAIATGGGLMNNSLLRLVDVEISHNLARALGPDATAQGGGIWNGVFLSGPPVRLDLRHVKVVHNDVEAPHGSRSGGGIYTTEPIQVRGLTLSGNRPNQCAGCS
jgi:Right handed beta helix region